jgi:hypothetical protein
VIAVAVAVIAVVILLTGGVVADSDMPDTLAFFGVTVRTTSAQVFLTGAICTWALLAAAWLLTAGVRRSRERSAQLALLRGHGRGQADGADAVASTSSLGESELASFLGFSTRPGGVVADRPGLGGGSDRAEPGQDPSEQPPLRQ